MTSSSHFNILMMSGEILIGISLSNVFLSAVSSIILRLTLNISRLLVRVMNCLGSDYFTLGVSGGCTLLVFSNWFNVVIGLGNMSLCSYYMRLTLSLIVRGLNIGLRSSLYMVLSITFVDYFYAWVGLFVFIPTVIYSCFYIAISCVGLVRSALYISFCMGLSIYIGLTVGCLRSALDITLGVGLSDWLFMVYVGCSWLIGVGIGGSIDISSSGIGIDYILVLTVGSRYIFLFISCHVGIVVIIMNLLRYALYMLFLSIEKIIILLSMYWSSFNLNRSRVDINRSSIDFYISKHSRLSVTMSNQCFYFIKQLRIVGIFVSEISDVESEFVLVPLSIRQVNVLN